MKSTRKQKEAQLFNLFWKLTLAVASFISVMNTTTLLIRIYLATTFMVPIFIDLIYFSSIYGNYDDLDEYKPQYQYQYKEKYPYKYNNKTNQKLSYYYHQLNKMSIISTWSWIGLLISCIIWLFLESKTLIFITGNWNKILIGLFYVGVASLIIMNYVFVAIASTYKLKTR